MTRIFTKIPPDRLRGLLDRAAVVDRGVAEPFVERRAPAHRRKVRPLRADGRRSAAAPADAGADRYGRSDERGVILRCFHHAAAREQKLPAQRAARRRRLTLECTEGGFSSLGEDLGNGAAWPSPRCARRCRWPRGPSARQAPRRPRTCRCRASR